MRGRKQILSVLLSTALFMGNIWMFSGQAMAGLFDGFDVFKEGMEEALEDVKDTVSDLSDLGMEALGAFQEALEEGVSIVNGRLENVGEMTDEITESASGVLTDAGEKAAEKVDEAGKTIINGVTLLGDTLEEQIDFIWKYQVGETKLEEVSEGKYDLYISHTILVLLTGASEDTVQTVLKAAVPSLALVLTGLKGVALYGLIEHSIGKLAEIDEGMGVVIHLDLSSLEGIKDSILLGNTEAQ